MAQNVGPILEMVTEKYLLRSEAEWAARQEAIAILRSIEAALCRRRRARDRPRHHAELLRPHPDDHPLGLEPLHRDADRRRSGRGSAAAYWGFLMLGGISGGGMGFIFEPAPQGRGPGLISRS